MTFSAIQKRKPTSRPPWGKPRVSRPSPFTLVPLANQNPEKKGQWQKSDPNERVWFTPTGRDRRLEEAAVSVFIFLPGDIRSRQFPRNNPLISAYWYQRADSLLPNDRQPAE